MIKHIVCWKLKEQAESHLAIENAFKIKSLLEALISKIPQIGKLEIGINEASAPSTNWSLVLYSEFDSWEDLQAYQSHPEHVKAGAFVKSVTELRSCVDYKI